MKTKKITLTLGDIHTKGHENGELGYASEDVAIGPEQKKKLKRFLLKKKNRMSGIHHLPNDFSIVKEVNISIDQWFAALKEQENDPKPYLWDLFINVKYKTGFRGKGLDEDEVLCSSEYFKIGEIKEMLKQLEPEFEFEYIEPKELKQD